MKYLGINDIVGMHMTMYENMKITCLVGMYEIWGVKKKRHVLLASFYHILLLMF